MPSGVCADCKNPYPHLQKAHIVAKHKGGTNDSSNIVLVCPNCHHLRDRGDRIAWTRRRWELVPAEQRSADAKARMDALSPEQRMSRASKIAKSKTGKPHPVGHRTGGARVLTQEQLDRRAAAVRAAYAKWTPEQHAAHAAKVSAGKRKKNA